MSILSKHRNLEIIPGTPGQIGTPATPSRPGYYTTEMVCENHQSPDPYYMRWATIQEQRACLNDRNATMCELAKYCTKKAINSPYLYARITGGACTLEGHYSILCVGYKASENCVGIVHATFELGDTPPSGVENKLYNLMHPYGYEDDWVFSEHYNCDDSTGIAVLEDIEVEGYG